MSSSAFGVDRGDFQGGSFEDSQSKGSEFRERELKVWSGGSEGGEMSDGLDGHRSIEKTKWDQFRANEEKFGVKTTFDENLYTTKLDKSSSFYKKRSNEAEKISREILGEACINIHLAEERGHIVGEDEEEKYGAVMRRTSAYVPPAFRRQIPSTPPNSSGGSDLDDVAYPVKLTDSRISMENELKTDIKDIEGDVVESKVETSRLNLSAPEFIPAKLKSHSASTSASTVVPFQMNPHIYPFYPSRYGRDSEYTHLPSNGMVLQPYMDGATYFNPYAGYYGPPQTPQSPYENVYYYTLPSGHHPSEPRKKSGK